MLRASWCKLKSSKSTLIVQAFISLSIHLRKIWQSLPAASAVEAALLHSIRVVSILSRSNELLWLLWAMGRGEVAWNWLVTSRSVATTAVKVVVSGRCLVLVALLAVVVVALGTISVIVRSVAVGVLLLVLLELTWSKGTIIAMRLLTIVVSWSRRSLTHLGARNLSAKVVHVGRWRGLMPSLLLLMLVRAAMIWLRLCTTTLLSTTSTIASTLRLSLSPILSLMDIFLDLGRSLIESGLVSRTRALSLPLFPSFGCLLLLSGSCSLLLLFGLLLSLSLLLLGARQSWSAAPSPLLLFGLRSFGNLINLLDDSSLGISPLPSRSSLV